MNQPLRVLMVEDSEDDAALLLLALRGGGYKVVHAVVDTPAAMRAELERRDWDVITSGHAIPNFSAPAALALAKELRPDVPFIIVSGEIDLNLAVSLMKEGAQDFVQKRELPRLVPAIERELKKAGIHRERQQTKEALEISETRYRRLFETAQDGILILDADTGQILDVNPFMIEMLGYSKEEFVGKKLWEIGAFQDVAASRIAFGELQSKGYVRYEDLPLEASDGRRINVEFVSNVYYVNHTKVAQCNIRDITDRRRAEEKIKSLLSEKELLLKEVHHRIKNNMSTIAALLSLQAHTQNDPSISAALNDARSRVMSMGVIYDKLYRSHDFRNVSAKEYLESLIDEISATFYTTHIATETHIKECSLDSNILFPLGIIINELITNAHKYAFPEGRKGTIAVSLSQLQDGTFEISVRDDGIGISGTVDIEHSPGFGVSLVKDLATQIDGTFQCLRDKGTEFRIGFRAESK